MQKLEQCLGMEPGVDFSQLFLCEDDMADDTRLESWWSACLNRKEGGDPAMKGQSVYKQLVARFSLPLTTVKMFLGRQPRLQIWTQGHMVHAVGEEFGRDFTRLALFPSQLEVLEERPDEDEEDDVRILHGPPGTAKTVVLVLKGVQWLSEDCKIVFVLQTSSDGAAAGFLVSYQLRKSARRGNDSVHLITLLDVWDSYRDEWKEGGEQKLRSLVQVLRQHATTNQNKAVHILADEANCVVVSKLFKALKDPQDSYITVKLWAAGVDLEIPDDMQDKVRKLTEPLRCPPSVVAEVQQAWDLSDGKVPSFSRPTVQLVSTGPPVLVVEHYHRRCKKRHGHVTQGFDYPWRCEECGRQVAKKLLEKLHVGRHDYAAPGQGSLTFNDVFVLGSTIDCRATTTDDHNNSPAPFIRGLQSLSTFIPTRKVGEDDTETIRMLAEMSTRTSGVSETKTRGSFTDENSRAEMISTTSRDAGGSNFIIDNALIGVDGDSFKSDAEMQEASPTAATTVLQKTEKIDSSDAVTVVREENIWGLERKVIVYLDQGGNFGADGTGRLRSFSRSTSQLIWVRPAMHTANT
ncbi:hypothetical protein V1264_025023 [Littorina saxatilis]|uniref:C2H2-type domain-containing protein n=2 Tax=Littorina saxatilis TaxID=31220 RepID=A0AAN9ALN2_9CAEN